MERRLVPHLVLTVASLIAFGARLALPMDDHGLVFLLSIALPAMGVVAAWRYRRERLAVLATAEAAGEPTSANPRQLAAAATITTLVPLLMSATMLVVFRLRCHAAAPPPTSHLGSYCNGLTGNIGLLLLVTAGPALLALAGGLIGVRLRDARVIVAGGALAIVLTVALHMPEFVVWNAT
jgi:hypothetical protein